MSRIFGVWNTDEGPIERDVLARMGDSLSHRESCATELAIHRSHAMGCRLFRVTPESASENQPVTFGAESMLVFDGRLDNRDDLVASLRARTNVPSTATDPDLVAAAYQVSGPDCVRQLSGDFSLALFDAHDRRLLLARDAIGVRPLYYCRTRDAVLFASSVKALFAHPRVTPRPNDRLLAELMLRRLHRRYHDGTTFFEGISEVQPSHTVILTERSTTSQRYWDFTGRPEFSSASFEDVCHEFRHHFQRAVQRRMRSARPVAVSVSGGLDSSAIFCTAQALSSSSALSPRGFTYTSRDGSAADETVFVEEVERHTGQTIAHVDLSAPALFDRLPEVARDAEIPLLDPQRRRMTTFLDAVQASGCRVLLTGHWGDQLLFNQAYFIDLLNGFSWGTLYAHLRRLPVWYPDTSASEFHRGLLSDFLWYDMPRWTRQAIRGIRGAFRPPTTATPESWFSPAFREQAGEDVFGQQLTGSALASDLYREMRSRYHAVCLNRNNQTAIAHGLEPAFPFLDRDLVDFVMRVPGTLAVRNGVPKALLREGLKDIVPDTILRRRGKADFTEIVNNAGRLDATRLTQLLGPDALVVQLGYVDGHRLKQGLTRATASLATAETNTVSWQLDSLVAFEYWLQEFIASGTRTTERGDVEWTNSARPIVR